MVAMQRPRLDLATLHVESFRTVEADTDQSPAFNAVTLRECPTNDWTCPYTG
jgi:hypothetical protein